ncbi:hypothetical protein ACHAO4_001391 [Trichoderma viride]
MAPLLDGSYTIANNVQQNPVLDLDGATNPFANPIAGVVADGATLDQIESSRYDPVYNEVTRWKINNIDGNNYQIESVPFPGKVMDLEMANPVDGTRVILYPNNKTLNQIWTFIPNAIP